MHAPKQPSLIWWILINLFWGIFGRFNFNSEPLEIISCFFPIRFITCLISWVPKRIILGLSLAFAAQGIAGSALGGIDLGVKISYPLIIGSLVFSFFLGIFSGVLPALQASKLNVVDALRS